HSGISLIDRACLIKQILFEKIADGLGDGGLVTGLRMRFESLIPFQAGLNALIARVALRVIGTDGEEDAYRSGHNQDEHERARRRERALVSPREFPHPVAQGGRSGRDWLVAQEVLQIAA